MHATLPGAQRLLLGCDEALQVEETRRPQGLVVSRVVADSERQDT